MSGPHEPRSLRPRASSYIRTRASHEGSELQRLKDALAMRGLSPRKRFGQNFLTREDLCERIVEHARVGSDDTVLEIGPGAGALTPRLARRARHVVAVEKDLGMVDLLREEFAELSNLEVLAGDFLEFDLVEAARTRGVASFVVVGNIPYNVTTPILERLFEASTVVSRAVLLVQKEYAERLAAAPGTPEYGALTLFARYHAHLERLMTLKAANFWPRPDVDSMLIGVHLREHPPVEAPEALLFRIIRGAFRMRRKQLANTVADALDTDRETTERLGERAGIDLRRRGETLSLEEFARLARAAQAMDLGDGASLA